MMDSPELIILDVGHGNSAIVRDTNRCWVIDCAPGPTLKETLIELGISEIDTVLLSHADADHIGGLMALLTDEDIRVRNVRLNPDPLQQTEMWEDLRYAVRDARARFGTKVLLGVTTAVSGELNVGRVEIEILAPTPELAMSGVGGRDLTGRRLRGSHAMSVVVGIRYQGHRVALLPGDVDGVGLDHLLANQQEIAAELLVFPHHGGSPGHTDAHAFAQRFCHRVRPKLVIFSIDRRRFSHPKAEIIAGVKSAVPETHILCTQLSKKCAADLPDSDFLHLNALPAKGKMSRRCCGGTVRIRLDRDFIRYNPDRRSHRAFIDLSVPEPMCLRMKGQSEKNQT